MALFSLHKLLSGLKVRITALYQTGDQLYVGCANGNLQIYRYDTLPDVSIPKLELVQTQAFGRRPIDQLGILPQTNQLVVLSDSTITLYSLPDFAKSGTTVLSQARNAHGFAITTYTASPSTKKGTPGPELPSEPVLRDLLVVGCRKKVVVFGAGRRGMKDAWELSLPHSPRTVIIPSSSTSSTSRTIPLPESIHLLYSSTSSVILHINPTSAQRLTVSDVTTSALPPAISVNGSKIASTSTGQMQSETGGGSGGLGMGMGALTGLGGYVGLGGKAGAPVGISTGTGEVLLARDDVGAFYTNEGTYARQESLHWPGSADALVYSNPYIYSAVPIIPTASTSSSASTNAPPTSAIQIHLSPTLSLRQTLSIPQPTSGGISIGPMIDIDPGPSVTPATAMQEAIRVLFVSTPTDKALAVSEGSSIWALRSSNVGDQVDELVREGRVTDAIGLVEAVGEAGLSPNRRLPHLNTLLAVQQFASSQFQIAIDTFLTYNINPALVISLYPAEIISGRSHVSRNKWMELFGAVEGARLEPETSQVEKHEDEGFTRGLLGKVTGLGVTKKRSMDTLRTGKDSKEKDEDTLSAAESDKLPPAIPVEEHAAPRASLEALMYYLSERRQKLTGAISTHPLPPESAYPPLSTLSAEQLHALPNAPMSELEGEVLLRMAQVIYTGLIKVYLVARPVLVGSLCRIENWCDVEEVEGLLKAQKKFSDLIDLYQGKKMHGKALNMLHELAKEEDDRLDRYPPTVRYLQKLGPTELPLILQSSEWIVKEDPKMALHIFTVDEPEVEALPRREVMEYLEGKDKGVCTAYLEHIINTLKEEGSDFHDRLAGFYLDQARGGTGKAETEEKDVGILQFLRFLTDSTHYRPYRLLSKLSEQELPEARAILLGRIGKHEEALRIYVYRLKDYVAAERYCLNISAKQPDPHGIFLMLLHIYLRPPPPTTSSSSPEQPILLEPALSLIATQSTKLDASEVLNLLPPLVTMEDIKSFLIRTVRDGFAKRNEARVVKSLVSGRKEQVERTLMDMQVKKVRVTDQRICPQCQKRLGQSAIAVHAPRGEVTHLHCKDLFSAELARVRG